MADICDGITLQPDLNMAARSTDHMPIIGDDMAGRIRGEAFIEVVGPDGEVKQHVGPIPNTICTHGETYLALQLSSGAQAVSSLFGYVGIGTTSTAPTTDDTALANETGTRQNGTRSASGRTFQVTCNFASNNPAGAATIREGALFQTNTAGAILSHITTSDINKGASDNINVTYSITW